MRFRSGAKRVVRGSCMAALLTSTAVVGSVATATSAVAAVNLCGHPADTVPPQISALTFSSQTADTTSGSATVTLTAQATDTATASDGSGVKHLRAYLTGPHGSNVEVKFALSSGTADAGTWVGTAAFTQQDWPGTYQLREVWVSDAAKNYQDYGANDTTATSPTDISLQSGWDSSLTLTGPTPVKTVVEHVPSGKLSAFSVSPNSVNTTTATKRVVIRARFTGHQPRTVSVRFDHHAHGTGHALELGARLHDVSGEWRGHVTVPQWVGDVKPSVVLYALFHPKDRPEFRGYTNSTLKAMAGVPSLLSITSTVDTTPPTLTGLTVTPSSVDTTTGIQIVNVSATATDDVSGVNSIDVTFEKNSKLPVVFASGSNSAGVAAAPGFGRFGFFKAGGYVNVQLSQVGSTWQGTAKFRQCVPSGKWHVSAAVADHATNGKYLSSSALSKLGFPSTLQVASAPQYVYDPVVTAATAAGAYHQITLDFDEGVQNLTTGNLTAYAMSPKSARYQQPLTISAIACSNGIAIIDCSGSGGLVTSAVLTIPEVTGGKNYEVWADLGATTSQITDAGGLPVSWEYAVAQVRGD